MKKNFKKNIFITTIFILIIIFPFVSAQQDFVGPRQEFPRGDVNSDGRIDLSDVVTTLRYLFSGDIHEAAGMITDINGNPIREGVYSPQLFATPGAALDGNYGIATFRDDGTASFTRYNVTGMKVDYVNDLILNFR